MRHPVTRYYYNAGYPDVLCSWFQSFLRQLKYNPGFMAWLFFPYCFQLAINQSAVWASGDQCVRVFVYLTYCLTNKNHVLTENGDDPWWECDYWLLDLTDLYLRPLFFFVRVILCTTNIGGNSGLTLSKPKIVHNARDQKGWKNDDFLTFLIFDKYRIFGVLILGTSNICVLADFESSSPLNTKNALSYTSTSVSVVGAKT